VKVGKVGKREEKEAKKKEVRGRDGEREKKLGERKREKMRGKRKRRNQFLIILFNQSLLPLENKSHLKKTHN
jgi:hypothetical protein